MKLLVVEDDQQLSHNLTQQLEAEGFAVDAVGTIAEASVQMEEFSSEYDTVVLDITLPDGSGFDLCEHIRSLKIKTPIIMMTAKDTTSDKIKGLNIGADDYVTKPIEFQELLARIRAMIRRNSKEPLPELSIGGLSINPQTQLATRDGKVLDLTSKEFSVLELLARHSDEVVTRTMIMEHVWGSDFETFSNVIDVYIKTLRQKIDKGRKQKLIHTIRGSGYSLSSER